MTIDDAISELNSKKDIASMQLADWLKELKCHRASIANSGNLTVRELIWRLLELDVDREIYIMDDDGIAREIKIADGLNDYFLTLGKEL